MARVEVSVVLPVLETRWGAWASSTWQSWKDWIDHPEAVFVDDGRRGGSFTLIDDSGGKAQGAGSGAPRPGRGQLVKGSALDIPI